MANVSVAVEIETRTEHDLSTVLQGVADDQSVNVGTLVTDFINSSRTRYCTTREKCGQLALTARFPLVIHAERRNLRLRRTPKRSGSQKLPKNTMRGRRFPAGLWIIEIFQNVSGGRTSA